MRVRNLYSFSEIFEKGKHQILKWRKRQSGFFLKVLSVLLGFISVDCSKTGELHQQATCYVYVLRLRRTLLKLPIVKTTNLSRHTAQGTAAGFTHARNLNRHHRGYTAAAHSHARLPRGVSHWGESRDGTKNRASSWSVIRWVSLVYLTRSATSRSTRESCEPYLGVLVFSASNPP